MVTAQRSSRTVSWAIRHARQFSLRERIDCQLRLVRITAGDDDMVSELQELSSGLKPYSNIAACYEHSLRDNHPWRGSCYRLSSVGEQ